MDTIDSLVGRIRTDRTISGSSAILLPFAAEGTVDWGAFEAHVVRTVTAGLTPAVNMDTGYVQLLDAPTRQRALEITASITSNFVAGAFVADVVGSPLDVPAYLRAAAEVTTHGGTPVVFPSWGLNELPEREWVEALGEIGSHLDRFLAFELGEAFVPYGRIVSLDAYEALMRIPSCIGAKHSSLHRQPEWDRLALRDRVRPDFSVLTGNDLAIDMVMYGSDYLLGLSTFAPEEFALRDRLFADGDPAFFELNDLLQYLGTVAFRSPTPAYRHDAAIFFELRGWASSDLTPPGVPRRDPSERALLADIWERLQQWR